MKITYGDDGWPVGLKTGQLFKHPEDKPVYCAKNNDTPRKICDLYGQNLTQFLRVNKKFYGVLSPSSRLRRNTLVVLPSKRIKPKTKPRTAGEHFYKTEVFDTIEKIAKKFQCRPDLIVSLNKNRIRNLNTQSCFQKPTNLKVPNPTYRIERALQYKVRKTRLGDAFQASVGSSSTSFCLRAYRKERHSILGTLTK